MNEKAYLSFHGGVGSVTGANFLLEAGGKRILVDCGLVQGSYFADEENRKDFVYDPSSIDVLFITHAHIDHIGRIPKLVAEGFSGKIYSTPETQALAELMFQDALKLIEAECQKNGTLPLYEHKDVVRALGLWNTISYHERSDLTPDVSVYAKDAGHILGSAMYCITFPTESGEKRTIVFTGDLGNTPSPILKDTEPVENADYIVMESVYGDRNHEDRELRRTHLKEVIVRAIKRKGTLIIPTFSIEKTQVLLYELRILEEKKDIPSVPVFLDSPLAIEVTKVYESMRHDFNQTATSEGGVGDIFKFPHLKHTPHSEQSKAIRSVDPPKIIIAGSGMSNGGRIMHHEVEYLPGGQNTILFIGYQAAGTVGRHIQDGAKEVMINGQKVPVRARVETITGYSSHKDSDNLVSFIETASQSKPHLTAFVVMGEPKSALFLAQRLREYVGVNAIHPDLGQKIELV